MSDLARRLRDALQRADFTYDAVADLLGPRAHDALGRNETTPGLRRTAGGSGRETLTRLFLLQAAVADGDAERALPGLVDDLARAGFVQRSGGEVRALLDVRPYAADETQLWVVSDLTPGLDGAPIRLEADHVLGISPAATSLAQLTVRGQGEQALDLGTGCGVQALHLAAHAAHVVATDVNARALRITDFNVALNGFDNVEVLAGSLLEPVSGRRYDLITTNPPFVISPGTGDRLVYRDSGLPGDGVVERIVREAPDHLVPGGWLQVLANWVVHRDVPWDERLAGWVREDCSAFVVQREVLDPAEYVELWLKDAGRHGAPDYRERYDAWLGWFDEQRVQGIGFGWINVQRAERGSTFLDWPYAVEQPIAAAIRDWSTAVQAVVTEHDRLVLRVDVVQETTGQPGAEDPETIVLRQQRGLRRARQVDTVEAALVGACDGDLTVGQILDALATLTERDPGELRARYHPVVRELVVEGFLVPRSLAR